MDIPILDTASMDGNILETDNVGTTKVREEEADVDEFMHHINEIVSKVDELEQRVNEVAQFYSSLNKKQLNNTKVSSIVKDKDKEKQLADMKKPQQDAAKREASRAKRMQELMRQFATILRQITQLRLAEPFLHPVDVVSLGLHDYYEVIEKPMDFQTIKDRMETKDGTGYKNVREIYADVRLIFKNAMTYNAEKTRVHNTGKILLEKFEKKWLQLLPKVVEEETRRNEEDAEAQLDMQLAQEAANAKMARDISNELYEVDMDLDELREIVVQNYRKMSLEEKRKLGSGLSQLSPEDLTKALEIIAQKNPSFQATAQEVDVDMDAQRESTLWRLKFFVKEALEAKRKSYGSKVGNDNSKRKRELCNALVKTAKKRSKKPSC